MFRSVFATFATVANLRERLAFLEAVAQGMADVEAGRVIGDEELGKKLDVEFGRKKAALVVSDE